MLVPQTDGNEPEKSKKHQKADSVEVNILLFRLIGSYQSLYQEGTILTTCGVSIPWVNLVTFMIKTYIERIEFCFIIIITRQQHLGWFADN